MKRRTCLSWFGHRACRGLRWSILALSPVGTHRGTSLSKSALSIRLAQLGARRSLGLSEKPEHPQSQTFPAHIGKARPQKLKTSIRLSKRDT